MTTKWEYGEMVIPSQGAWSWYGPAPKQAVQGFDRARELNHLGAEGWELTGYTENPAGARYVFKRPAAE